MGYRMDFTENINQLPKANLPHMMVEKHFKGTYNFSTACTDYLQKHYMEVLKIKRGWTFVNPSTWFLTSIKDYVEFAPELLESLQPRSILPFLKSFRYTGTYYGFELLCKGIFGEDVTVTYEDPYIINIDGISSAINYKILGEGEQDFYLITEDMNNYLITEDEFVPPQGIWIIEKILRQNLPAGIGEIVTINFV